MNIQEKPAYDYVIKIMFRVGTTLSPCQPTQRKEKSLLDQNLIFFHFHSMHKRKRARPESFTLNWNVAAL